MKPPSGSGKGKSARITWTVCPGCDRAWSDGRRPCPHCGRADRTGRKRVEKSRLVDSANARKDLERDWSRQLQEIGVIVDRTPTPAERRSGRTWRDAAELFKTSYATPPVWRDGQLESGMRSWQDAHQRIGALTAVIGAETPIEDITYPFLRVVRAELLKRKVSRRSRKTGAVYETDALISPSTVNRMMSTASAVLSAAVDEGWLEVHPFPSGRKKRAQLITTANERERMRILTEAEEARLLAACDEPMKYRRPREGRARGKGRLEQSRESPRRHLRPILIALLDTGMRWGELKGLRWKDVQLSERLIVIIAQHTKTLTERVVGITDRLYTLLAAMHRNAPPDPNAPVFGIRFNIDTSWRTVRKKAQLEGVRIHDLRHTFATRMIQRGFPEKLVGRLLGHTVPSTTYRYTNTDAAIARQGAELLNPETVN